MSNFHRRRTSPVLRGMMSGNCSGAAETTGFELESHTASANAGHSANANEHQRTGGLR